MKFIDLLKVKENDVLRITWDDGFVGTYRIHDDKFEGLWDGKWTDETEITVAELLCAENIELSWSPKEGDMVYYINFNAPDNIDATVYSSTSKNFIDTLSSLGLIFRSEKELIEALHRRK